MYFLLKLMKQQQNAVYLKISKFIFLINFQWHFNFLFTEAFQCSETNGSNGIDETDLAVLTGILSNPAVTQKFKVSNLYLETSIFIYWNFQRQKTMIKAECFTILGSLPLTAWKCSKLVLHFTFIELLHFLNEIESKQKNWRPYNNGKKVKNIKRNSNSV